MFIRFLIVVAVLSALIAPAQAVQPDEVLADPVLEERARNLSAKLRCLVCQNQSIDDSDAPLARDLRILLRERLSQGESDTQVMDYLVNRYGEFILLKPKMGVHTLVLWLGPFLLLLIGVAVIARKRQGRQSNDRERPLSSEEKRQVEELLHPDQ